MDETQSILARDVVFQTQGFTLIELVLVMVLLGILSFFALPRFFDLNAYQERGMFDETVAAVRYAQKLAVARGCKVQVRFPPHGYELFEPRPDCDSAAFSPLPDGHPVQSRSNNSVLVSVNPGGTSNATFDGLGRADQDLTVTVGGRSFEIVAETGCVDTGP